MNCPKCGSKPTYIGAIDRLDCSNPTCGNYPDGPQKEEVTQKEEVNKKLVTFGGGFFAPFDSNGLNPSGIVYNNLMIGSQKFISYTDLQGGWRVDKIIDDQIRYLHFVINIPESDVLRKLIKKHDWLIPGSYFINSPVLLPTKKLLSTKEWRKLEDFKMIGIYVRERHGTIDAWEKLLEIMDDYLKADVFSPFAKKRV
jgi:hypothetical protein